MLSSGVVGRINVEWARMDELAEMVFSQSQHASASLRVFSHSDIEKPGTNPLPSPAVTDNSLHTRDLTK